MREAVALEKQFIRDCLPVSAVGLSARGVRALHRLHRRPPPRRRRARAARRRHQEPAALARRADGHPQGAELLRGTRDRVPEVLRARRSSPTTSSRRRQRKERTVIIDFDEILDDLEVKRASLLPPDELPRLDVAAAIGGARRRRPRRCGCSTSSARSGRSTLTVACALGRRRARNARGRAATRTPTSRRRTELVAATGAGGARSSAAARRVGAGSPSADLSALVEAALIEHGALDVAKALVMRRSRTAPRRRRRPATLAAPIRRSGHVVAWNDAQDRGRDPQGVPLARTRSRAGGPARRAGQPCAPGRSGSTSVPIETVQDLVQEELVLAGQMRVAERYILYRAERAMLRARGRLAAPRRRRRRCRCASRRARAGLGRRRPPRPDPLRRDRARPRRSTTTELERELRRSIHDGIARADLDRLIVLNAKSLIERDADFSFFAGRILLTLHLRGDARLGHPPRRRRRACGGAPPRLAAGARARRRDRPRRRGAARLRPRSARPRRSTRPPTSTSTTSASRRSTTATCSSTRPAASRGGSRRRSCSGCASRWASASARARGPGGARARALPDVRERPLLLVHPDAVQRGHAALAAVELLPLRRRRLARVDRAARASPRTRCARSGPAASAARGRRCAAPARTSRATNGESQGVDPVPEAAQRPARRGQPGRQARRRRLRLPRGLAQRHPRLPRAAPQHRRRAPPHARHEHGLLDPRPVHEARRGARAVDALPQLRRARPARAATAPRSRSATSTTSARAARARSAASGSRRSSSGS